MEEKNNKFGDELRRLRGEHGYSQHQLGQLAGFTASYISQLETGDKNPTANVIHLLSPHLGVKPNQLWAILGMVEMDLSGTLAENLDQVKKTMPGLPETLAEELANYLTYLDFKEAVLTKS